MVVVANTACGFLSSAKGISNLPVKKNSTDISTKHYT
jgi:hypothetical protein